jgi:YtxH-like protein
MRNEIRRSARDLARLALKVGLLLTDSDIRDRIGGRVKESWDDISPRLAHRYEEAADRLEAASDALRGKRHWGSNVLNFVSGVGVGVGLGLLFAPAAGSETRQAILGRAGAMKDRVREAAADATERVQSFGNRPSTGTTGD